MTIDDRLAELFREGNPVPDPKGFKQADVKAARYLAHLERREGEMTKTDDKILREVNPRRGIRPAIVAAVLAAMVGIAAMVLVALDEDPVDAIDQIENEIPNVDEDVETPEITTPPPSSEGESPVAVGYQDFTQIEGVWFGKVIQEEPGFTAPLWADVTLGSGAEVNEVVGTIKYRTSAETDRVFCEGTWTAKSAAPPTYTVLEVITPRTIVCGNGTVTLTYDPQAGTLHYLWEGGNQVEGTLERR